MANTEMRHFPRVTTQKSNIKRLYADLSGGVLADQAKRVNGISSISNITSEKYPFLSKRKTYTKRDFSYDFTNGMGIFKGQIYYMQNEDFCCEGTKLFSVSEGSKKFLWFNEKIIILPDMMYYEPSSGLYGTLRESTGHITYCITKRIVGSVNWGRSCITSDTFQLTDIFKKGDGLYLDDGEGHGFGGFHKIIDVDEGMNYIFFEAFEFGDGGNITMHGTLSHGAPEGCDAACVCSGRLWVVNGSKIHASSINDGRNWAVGGDDEKASFACEYDNSEKIKACIEFKGNPVFFSENKIYRIYGDRASNFRLKCVSSWGGVYGMMTHSIAVVKDKIYYVSKHGITCFDGTSPRVLKNAPISSDGVAYSASDGRNYYIYTINSHGQGLYVYDTDCDFWQYHNGIYGALGLFEYNGAICALKNNSITVILDNNEDFIEGYTPDMAAFANISLRFKIDGGEPVVLAVDCSKYDTNGYSIMMTCDSTYFRMIGAISGSDQGIKKFSIVPRKTNTADISIFGSGEIDIKGIYMDVSY